MGWFLIAWINIIAGFNMLLALYKTVKETYGLLREKCCPQRKINVPTEDDGKDGVKDEGGGAKEEMDLEVVSLNNENEGQDVGFGEAK